MEKLCYTLEQFVPSEHRNGLETLVMPAGTQATASTVGIKSSTVSGVTRPGEASTTLDGGSLG